MKKIIVIPDSFKGTMPSAEVCEIVKNGLSQYFDAKNIITIPIADGGEGTTDCFMYVKNARRISLTVKGPLMEDVAASYVVFGDTAVIEMAAAAGFSLESVKHGASSPMHTTTYGVGQLIRNAVCRGCRKIIIGMGGSCTNDAGAGMAAAMGAVFLDSSGQSFIPVGKTLGEVRAIDVSKTRKLLSGVEIVGMCDITNPLYGPYGAAFVFAPQKGAAPDEVEFLDRQLRALSKTILQCLDVDVSQISGGGAAGGMGAGVHAFLGGRLHSGIELILELAGFDDLLRDCCAVITGEGRFDSQSLNGKAVSGICRHTAPRGIPVFIITGQQEKALDIPAGFGISGVFETGKIDTAKSMEEIHESCRIDLKNTVDKLGIYLKGIL